MAWVEMGFLPRAVCGESGGEGVAEAEGAAGCGGEVAGDGSGFRVQI